MCVLYYCCYISILAPGKIARLTQLLRDSQIDSFITLPSVLTYCLCYCCSDFIYLFPNYSGTHFPRPSNAAKVLCKVVVYLLLLGNTTLCSLPVCGTLPACGCLAEIESQIVSRYFIIQGCLPCTIIAPVPLLLFIVWFFVSLYNLMEVLLCVVGAASHLWSCWLLALEFYFGYSSPIFLLHLSILCSIMSHLAQKKEVFFINYTHIL